MASKKTIAPDPQHSDGLELCSDATQKLGFYGATPIVRRAAAAQAAATDATSTQALANEMRTVLVNLGLMKGSA